MSTPDKVGPTAMALASDSSTRYADNALTPTIAGPSRRVRERPLFGDVLTSQRKNARYLRRAEL